MARTPKLRYVDPYKQRGRAYRALCRFSATKAGAWIAENIAWKLDPHLLKLTRGRFCSAGPLATALLESRGARTGQARRNATLYFHDGERVTIIASKLGLPEHPFWFHNACANPHVLLGGQRFRVEVVDDEASRNRLWELADRVFPPYAAYRDRAARVGRTIPILRLVPR